MLLEWDLEEFLVGGEGICPTAVFLEIAVITLQEPKSVGVHNPSALYLLFHITGVVLSETFIEPFDTLRVNSIGDTHPSLLSSAQSDLSIRKDFF